MTIKRLYRLISMLFIIMSNINWVFAKDEIDVQIVLPVKGGCTVESPSTILMSDIQLKDLSVISPGTALNTEENVNFGVTAYCTSSQYEISIVPIETPIENECLLPKSGLRLCLFREKNISTNFNSFTEYGVSAKFNRKIGVDSLVIPFTIVPTRGSGNIDPGIYEISLMFLVDVL